MAYRLALDIGSNSIGWCCLHLDTAGKPGGIADIGVRIFRDGRNPKDGSSLASARRVPRSMRRNRDRYLQRRTALLNALTRHGLMPGDEDARRKVSAYDPYRLRAEALTRRLEDHELGRVLFHLNQHRGFKSNRKTDRAGDNEGSLIRIASRNLAMKLAAEGHQTIGSYLAARHGRREEVRVRLAGTGRTAAYPFYPLRQMVEDEFMVIWAAQMPLNLRLTEAMRKDLHTIIFHQRSLKDVPRGRCWLEPDEPRAFRGLPSVQAFRIAQDLAHLRLSQPGQPERPLSADERRALADRLLKGKDASFDQIRKLLRLPPETDFNLQSLRREELKGDETARRLGGKQCLGGDWHGLAREVQDQIATILMTAEKDEDALPVLAGLGLDAQQAERVLGAALPEGTASLSLTAVRKILPHLERGLRYSDAVKAAGYAHHSDQRTGEVRDRLPYYGELLFERIGTGTGKTEDEPEKRWGRAANPTVHVALNEVRRVVNAILDRHGPPAQIVVETLRDVGRSQKQRQEFEREQKKNQDANNRRRETLADMALPVNARNLVRIRLWEEQATDPKDRICPYSGRMITLPMALSDEIEEDHIIPFAVSLDDSTANRVLVTREANRAKSRRTPHEAFGASAEWARIVANAEKLPPQKRWRFAADALQKLAENGDFLARHMTDSAMIARFARLYLEVLAPGSVWSTPGRLTSLLRRHLGLNSDAVLGHGGPVKNRHDHRHHAVDAVVIGLTDHSLLQRVSAAAKRADEFGQRLIAGLPEPWPGFVNDVSRKVRSLIVSHKPDLGWQGALHNDTAYGIIAGAKKGEPNVVTRRMVSSLDKWTPEDARKGVRDPVLAEKIAGTLTIADPAARKAALAQLRHSGGFTVRRVRTVEKLEGIEPLPDRRTGVPYKAVKLDSNHRTEVWRLPDGKIRLEIVTTLEAARDAEAQRLGRKPPKDLRPHPAACLVARFHKNDMLALGTGAERKLFYVVKMTAGTLTLAEHHEGGALKARATSKDDAFKYFDLRASKYLDLKARKIWVDPSGWLRDPIPAA